MNTILAYLLKVIICSAIFYAYYLLMLRNKSFHPYNRFYLLATAILSFSLPFLHISMFDVASDNDQMLALMQIWSGNSLPTVTVGGPKETPWQTIAISVSLTVSLVLITIGLVRIYKVYHLRKVFPRKSIGPVTFINTNIQEAPFSFMKNLFWRRDILLDDAIGEQIYRHEMAHITQRHSWDKLFFQALKAVFWMNPIYYLMQRELLLIHEFIADEQAIENKDGAAFAQMLLRTQIGQFHYDPAHPVFYSSIKKRLLMITNSQKPRYSYLRRLMVLPLLFVVSFVFAIRAHRVEIAQQQKDLASITVQGYSQNTSTPNNLQEVTVVGYASPKDTTVKPEATAITVSDQLKDRAKIELSANSKNPPLVILNEDEEHPISMEQMKAISPNDIASMKVWKGERAISEYGQVGKNGVVEVITKDYSEKYQANHPEEKRNKGEDPMNLPPDKAPLFVLNGNPISQEQAKTIDPNQIKTVDILKEKSSVAIYGERAKNGVVLITTKSTVGELGQPVFSQAQTEASFPGGQASWKDYLEHNLKAQTPVNNGAPPGEYAITVSFLVNKIGNVSEVKAIKGPNPDYGCKAEAVRLIRESGKWNPAVKDGKPVIYREKQKIIFQVNE